MNDIGLVAVVDARKHLFHEHGGVTLGEFTTSQDFVEQLTTFADPTAKNNRLVSEQIGYDLLNTYSVTR